MVKDMGFDLETVLTMPESQVWRYLVIHDEILEQRQDEMDSGDGSGESFPAPDG